MEKIEIKSKLYYLDDYNYLSLSENGYWVAFSCQYGASYVATQPEDALQWLLSLWERKNVYLVELCFENDNEYWGSEKLDKITARYEIEKEKEKVVELHQYL